jgi:hypothetical protein
MHDTLEPPHDGTRNPPRLLSHLGSKNLGYVNGLFHLCTLRVSLYKLMTCKITEKLSFPIHFFDEKTHFHTYLVLLLFDKFSWKAKNSVAQISPNV